MSSGKRGGQWPSLDCRQARTASGAPDSDEVDCPARAVARLVTPNSPRTSSEAEDGPGGRPSAVRPTARRFPGAAAECRDRSRRGGPRDGWQRNHERRRAWRRRAQGHAGRLGAVCRLCPPLLASCDRRGDALRRPAAVLRGILLGGLHGAGAALPSRPSRGSVSPGHQWRDSRFRACTTSSTPTAPCHPFGATAHQRRRRARASTRSRRWRSRHRTTLHGLGRPRPDPSGSCSRTSPSAGCGPRPLRWLQA